MLQQHQQHQQHQQLVLQRQAKEQAGEPEQKQQEYPEQQQHQQKLDDNGKEPPAPLSKARAAIVREAWNAVVREVQTGLPGTETNSVKPATTLKQSQRQDFYANQRVPLKRCLATCIPETRERMLRALLDVSVSKTGKDTQNEPEIAQRNSSSVLEALRTRLIDRSDYFAFWQHESDRVGGDLAAFRGLFLGPAADHDLEEIPEDVTSLAHDKDVDVAHGEHRRERLLRDERVRQKLSRLWRLVHHEPTPSQQAAISFMAQGAGLDGVRRVLGREQMSFSDRIVRYHANETRQRQADIARQQRDAKVLGKARKARIMAKVQVRENVKRLERLQAANLEERRLALSAKRREALLAYRDQAVERQDRKYVRRSSGDAIEDSDAGLDIDEANEEEAASAMPPRSFEKDELAQCWYEVFCEVGLPASVAKMYSIGFSKFGIDDQNAGDLTDEDLAANGVANAQHRQIIMRLIQGLLEHQQDQAALDAVSSGVEVDAAQSAEDDQQKEVSWEEVDRQQHKLQEEIAKVDRLEANLARILAGDTDRQRAFKARLAKERAAREQEREQTRRDHALRKAKRAMERVQKDIDDAQ
ncbi:Hypothetical Protein FCC1311_048952 [Hondaea fermentalgiana]|uniref:SAM domain-containing protein n=1 Tax=Hondaea fermentalgiana TaxID=2315210 RepID=A0A2R5GLC0_9STRA|nr:Hypothetical Protein FCC1311_048952 [Hondaea fermentalgiana]|eukprot:GBG28674.1 Hypothetical Protein FCC1311_048952 [Hondaea fermentalgiana]